MSEFGWIRRYFAPLAASDPAALNLTDDAAFLTPPAGEAQVITVDAMVAGVHFLPHDPAGLIARKLLRVNLSDLAAKGARPACYFLSCALPAGTGEPWVADFCAGLAADQALYGIRLVGGDTVATPGPLCLSLTAVGYAAAPVLRGGGRAGDDLYVTGALGDGWLGLQRLTGALDAWEGAEAAVTRYRLPEPRMAMGLALPGLARCAMDVSDGLMADLAHLCRASACGAEVWLDALPLSESARNACARFALPKESLISRGDDYELLFAAPPAARDAVARAAARHDTPVTRIGRLTDGTEPVLRDGAGHAVTLDRAGFDHFAKS